MEKRELNNFNKLYQQQQDEFLRIVVHFSVQISSSHDNNLLQKKQNINWLQFVNFTFLKNNKKNK